MHNAYILGKLNMITFKRFEPLSEVAKFKILDILNRGGTLVKEKREYVEISRYQSIAKIDQYGRVEWRSSL